MILIPVFLISLAASILGSADPSCQGEADDPNARSLQYVMLGLKDARESLLSGQFRATGLYTESRGGTAEIKSNVEFLGAFDTQAELCRFDASVPHLILSPTDPSRNNEEKKLELQESLECTRLILTRAVAISYRQGSQRLVIQARDPKSDLNIPGLPFNPRTLGLTDWAGFRRDRSMADVCGTLQRLALQSIERDKSGIWKLVWEYTGIKPGERRIWIDENRGFTVTHSEIRYGLKDSRSAKPDIQSTVTWDSRNGQWIPVTFTITYDRGKRQHSYELAFEWQLVNEKPPENLFTKEGLVITERVQVYDTTSGHLVLEEILNDSPDHVSYYRTKPPGRPAHLWLILINGLALLALIGAVVFYRRRARGEAPS